MTSDYDHDDELTPEERFHEFLEEAGKKGQSVFRHEWGGFYADTAEVCFYQGKYYAFTTVEGLEFAPSDHGPYDTLDAAIDGFGLNDVSSGSISIWSAEHSTAELIKLLGATPEEIKRVRIGGNDG